MVAGNDSCVKAAAISLVRRGWAVFPCHAFKNGKCTCGKPCTSPGKHPATHSGFKDADTDPAVVEAMFIARPDCNVAIATGPASGVWVLDVEADGIESLEHLQQEHGRLPETVSVVTGGGGRHLYFRWNGVEIRNKTKLAGKPIDVRGAGGYVVVPPSAHASGQRYVWEHDPESTPIAEAPSWLVDLIIGNEEPSHLNFTVAGSTVEDLATAPGATKGQRHHTALRLVGSAIGRGLGLTEVAQLAVEWSRRCSPPMEETEVLRIVSDFFRKETAKDGTAQAKIEDPPLPEPIPWPVLGPDAYHGLVGDIVRVIEPETEADPAAILVQLLISFGNVVGRGPHFVVEGTAHYANLFGVLVGSTARGRKGTSEGRVRQILRFVDELWVLDNVQSGLVSGEGLVWSVRDAVYKIENVKEKGRIVGAEEVLADPGVSDKRLLVVEPEFAAVLRVCRRETNTLSPTLRSAWDSGVLRTMAKNSPAKATDAHISIVGHITVEELRGALTEVEGFNGFSNRFLWVAVRRSKLLPDGGREVDLSSYAARLAKALAHARSVGRVRRDPGATALWRTIYSGLANDTSTGLLAAVTSRAEAQVLRLSLIYALIDCSNIIREEHLRAALAVWQYCQGSAKLIFGGIGADPLQDKVLHTIKQHPNGITRWDLHKAVCKHKPAAVLVEKLTRLRDAGLIESKTVTTAGRPAEMWFPLQTRASIVSQGAVSVDEKTTTRTVNGDQGDLEKRDVGETRPQDGGLTSHSSLFSRVDEETARDEGGPFCSTGNDANLPDRGLTSHTSPLSHVEDDTARHEGDPPWPTGSDVSSQDGGLISHTSLFSHVEDEIARDQSESFRPTSDDVKSHGGEVASHTSLISHDEDDFEEVLV